jgi:rhamnose transport system permease protein
VQTINQFAASWILLALTVLAFSGQFLYLRLITLSLAVSFAGGAYAAALLGPGPAAPRLLAGVLGGVVLAAVGGIFDLWAGSKAKSLALLASFGFLKAFQGLVEACGWGGVGAMTLTFAIPSGGGLLATPAWLPTAFIGLAGFTTLLVIVYKTGKVRLKAIASGDDPGLAALFGVSVVQTTVIVQLLGGAIGGFAGVLMAADSGLRPDLGMIAALKAFGVLVATGGRWVLLLPGTMLLVAAENIAAYHIGGHAREAAGLVVLALALIVRPIFSRVLTLTPRAALQSN